tara:strand:+ start:1282 stop:2103 length:822 start_codon:yes stop_codon:yes gene_type:complete
MNSRTQELKNKVLSYDEPEKRLSVLKDAYKGETAYIIAGGPSLKNYSNEYLKEALKDKLVLSIKQAYDLLRDETDFHILNFTNFREYDWTGNKSIVLWEIFEQFHYEMIEQNNMECDLVLPVYRNNQHTGGGVGPDKMIYSVAEKGDFEHLKLDHPEVGMNQPWGPGIMYEICIPLAMHLGCSKIISVGWDIGDLNSFSNGVEDDTQRVFQEHFYGDEHKKIVYAKTSMGPREITSVAKSTEGMFKWLKENNIDWELASDRNPGYNKIPRVTL